jgi:hypothetical protein
MYDERIAERDISYPSRGDEINSLEIDENQRKRATDRKLKSVGLFKRNIPHPCPFAFQTIKHPIELH